MGSYRHYKYLSDNFPEVIKKAKENKSDKKETVEITEQKRLIVKSKNVSNN